MPGSTCRILSIAPYRVLPATTGGHWGIVSMHDALGRICQDHLLGTTDNGPDDGYAFQLHRIFPPHPRRYLPLHGLRAATGIARRYDATHIFCDHPYMAPLAIALSRRLRIPWALRSHNIEASRFRLLGKPWWPLLKAYEGFAMRSADAVFFITEEDCIQAIAMYGLKPAQCHLAPYGTTLKAAPGGHIAAKQQIASAWNLNPGIPWLYFLGVHSYAPNAAAVAHITQEIYPQLRAAGMQYEIIIGGKGLPQPLQDAIADTGGAIRYTGFIDDLDTFIKACDVMLNPLTSGGGIKTKAVEALAYNKVVVSTVNGAAGLLPEVCGDNLIVTPDGDWSAFCAAVISAAQREPRISPQFYERYSWDAIAQYVRAVLSQTKYA